MKKISEAQNEEKQILRLAAQREMYSQAKRIQLYHLITSVPLTVAVFLTAVFFPGFQKYAAYWGVIITLLDLGIIRRLETSLQQRAAKIQELFDCEVLQIPWNELKCRAYPDPEDVAEYSERHFKTPGNREKLQDWYSPTVDRLPLHLGRIVCQRSNVTWESRLRRRYATGIAALLILLGVIILAVWMVKEMRPEQVILNLLIPLLPAFVWGISHFNGNMAAAKNMDVLKELMDKLWRDAFAGKSTPEDLVPPARELQNQIFEHRQQAPLVPDRVYNKFRPKDQDLMYKGTAQLVEEALSLLANKGSLPDAGN